MNFLKRLNHVEPARVHAVFTSVVALLASLGFVVGADVENTFGAIMVVVFTLLPLLQGETTRSVVYSPETVEDLTAGE